jgi:hypothetical protein
MLALQLKIRGWEINILALEIRRQLGDAGPALLLIGRKRGTILDVHGGGLAIAS